MSCDCGRAIPRWILSSLNFVILVISLFLLFMGIIMAVVPDQVISLLSYLLNQVSVSEETKIIISSLMSITLISDCGKFLLCSSVCIILPSSLGYVGAMRESRILLFLVSFEELII